MARIRSIKPEVRKSRTVTSWPRDVRLTWVFLWCYLDDEGRGEDDMGLVKAELYPRDKDVSETKLDGWLWVILHAVNWGSHQRINRPGPSKCPPCPRHEHGAAGFVRNSDGSRSDHVRLTERSVNELGVAQ
jgi:hypothetical protein